MRQIGAFAAQTHFSALVEAAEHGETVVITRNGRPVAQIGPPPKTGDDARAAMDRLLSSRVRLGVPMRELIEEGRRTAGDE